LYIQKLEILTDFRQLSKIQRIFDVAKIKNFLQTVKTRSFDVINLSDL
jgi:hypothetical protein